MAAQISKAMNPNATVFTPLSALNAPRSPWFNRTFFEFRAHIALYQLHAEELMEKEYIDDFDILYFGFVGERLLGTAKELVYFLRTAYLNSAFEHSQVWARDCITEMMLLCHKYSWTTIQFEQHVSTLVTETDVDEDDRGEFDRWNTIDRDSIRSGVDGDAGATLEDDLAGDDASEVTIIDRLDDLKLD